MPGKLLIEGEPVKGLFARSEHNPLLTARELPYVANAVFNAGAADLGDEVVLLLRVESCSGRSHLIVARSPDGETNWEVADRALLHSEQGYEYEANGVEDCRITWVPQLDAWALAYTAYTPQGAGVALAATRDFRTVKRMGMVLPPVDKNAALFPRRFGDDFALLHRPSELSGSVWLSYSPDLVYWGKSELVLPVREGAWWDGVRVGAGMPPIETEDGWLLVYHGVKELARAPIYRMGAALLDLEQPHRLISRSRRWLMSPSEPYERMGDAGNVIFSCGGFVRGDELWMYYGAADSSVCLAKAKLPDVISMVQEENVRG